MGRLRNIGNRLRAGGGGGSAFDLASLFPAAGLWYSADVASGFQDSAGTTPLTASGEPVGKRADKSGNGLHALQATAAARPVYTSASGIQYDLLDGVDDSLSATFAAGTLTSNMDCFVAIKRATTASFILANEPGAAGAFFAAVNSASGASPHLASGTPTYLVNGVSAGATRMTLHAALTVGSWVILEVRNLDLSGAAWDGFAISGWTGERLNGQLGTRILIPAQSDAIRTQIRQTLATEKGVTL